MTASDAPARRPIEADAPVAGALRRDARVYVAGHRGLAGSALRRALAARGFAHVVERSHAELDLTDQAAVRALFRDERPELVFLCAARVGGIAANVARPADFIGDNLAIQTNVIHEAWRAGVEDLVFLGSSCIYPRDCPQPIREEALLTGPLEATNRAYAVAKIAGVEMCHAYNRQHGTRYLALMPTNLYGPGDNYDPESSHVLAALVRRTHEAKVAGAPSLTAWGTGAPRREFLWSDDLAEAALLVAGLPAGRRDALLDAGGPPLVNVGHGRDISIRELAARVAAEIGYQGEIRWDAGRPDGVPAKRLDVSRLGALGWRPKVGLREGIRRAYADFLETHAAPDASAASSREDHR